MPTIVQLPTEPVVDLQLATGDNSKIAGQDPIGSPSGAKSLPATPAASTAVHSPVPKKLLARMKL